MSYPARAEGLVNSIIMIVAIQHYYFSQGAVKYIDCTSAEGYDHPPNECPGYDTKQSDGEVPAVLEL